MANMAIMGNENREQNKCQKCRGAGTAFTEDRHGRQTKCLNRGFPLPVNEGKEAQRWQPRQVPAAGSHCGKATRGFRYATRGDATKKHTVWMFVGHLKFMGSHTLGCKNHLHIPWTIRSADNLEFRPGRPNLKEKPRKSGFNRANDCRETQQVQEFSCGDTKPYKCCPPNLACPFVMLTW